MPTLFLPYIEISWIHCGILASEIMASYNEHSSSTCSRIAVSLRETVLSLRLPIAERIPHSVREEAHVIFKYCQLTHGYGPDAVSLLFQRRDNGNRVSSFHTLSHLSEWSV